MLQTRASRVRDVLTTREVNEIADTQPGALQTAVSPQLKSETAEDEKRASVPKSIATTTQISYASVGKDGKVEFEKREKDTPP